ncbi:unnamed protein product [Brachionus calyciflorus]|uniref:TLC domain-containing protein n=1 Tax=Brachionus calyciflorus TaxID=104777 RepID=A0A813MG50_9BILA|nr:unnamed protein product [Brachionus calyciflorus]
MGTGIRKRPGTNKQVPYLSHEFIIQNHGDIATCVCMVFIVGLMFQTTSPLAISFIAPKHNVTELDQNPVLYTYGLRDLCLLFFYTVTAVIFHAIIQEYVLDKLMRKVRLSKTKANKFNESGQLLSFYALSCAWAVSIFKDEGYFQSLNFFWTGYPHVGLTFMAKFYFIIQMSYWIHVLPELYFQKVKREEMAPKITFAAINFVISALVYLLNFSRIGITLIFIDHVINVLFHFSRLMHFSGKNKIARTSFNIYNVLFVLARLSAIILSIFVFWFGLKSSSVDSINFEERNFNTPLVRTASLASILLLQTWMLWNFIMFQCKKIRENSKTSLSKTTIKPVQSKKVKTPREGSDVEGETSDSEKVKAQ